MFSVPHSRLWRYSVILLSVAVALLVSTLFRPVFEEIFFALFIAAVIFNIWYGGPRSGLLTTLLFAVVYTYYLLPPQYTLELVISKALRLGAFVFVGLLISAFYEARRRAEEVAYQQRQEFQATLASIDDAVITTDQQGHVTLMNRVAEALLGRRQSEVLGQSIEDIFIPVDEETQQPIKNPVLHMLQEGKGLGLANHTTLIARNGTQRPIDNSVAPIKDASEQITGAVLVFRDITDQKRVAFLGEINTVLASVPGYESQLEKVAHFVVLDLADWCVIDILENNNSIGPVAGAIRDVTKQALLAEMQSRYLPTLKSPQPVAEVLRTGASKLYPEITDEMLAMTAHDDTHLELMRELGCASMMIVPLVAHGRILGAITLVSAELGHRYTTDELMLAEELGRRIGLAVDNVRLYDEVREQRQRLQVTLASIGDAVITTDTKGRITFMNGVAETLTRWTFNDTTETYLHEVFQIINETTREPVEDPVAKVLRENAVVGLGNHPILIAKDGTELPIDDSGAPIRDEKGMIVGIILVFRDIAERRQRETALDATLQRTQDLYETCRRIGLVSNPDEVVQALLTSHYLNHATQCAILTFNTLWNHERPDRYEVTASSSIGKPLVGFDAGGSLAGSSLANLLSRDTPVFVEDTHTDARLDQETRDLFALTINRSMMIFPLIASRRCFGMLLFYFASPQHWSQEDYRHIQVFVDQVCVTMDNVRLFAAEALAHLEAEQANQIKLKFLAMISHELRTPLTSIKGFATTLLATDVTWDAESQRDFIAIIDEESDKLTDLIGQLLDLSRLQAGKLRIQPEPRRLNEIIGTAMAQLESISAQHRLVFNIGSDLPPMMADMQRIAEVLVNLVSNAAKYAPRATQITVSATTHGANIQITVGDEGPGIPIANRDSVFEAFLQLENSPLQQGKGLGLGLAICKGLIEAHGGKIWIADTSSGTTVSFTLPIATSR